MAPDSLLIFRLGSIGDTAVAVPCFRAIARTFPAHRRIVLTNAPASVRASSVQSLLENTGLVQEFIDYPVGRWSLFKMLRLLRRVRSVGARTMIYLQPRPSAAPVLRDLAFFRAAGVSRFVGLPLARDARRCRVDPDTGELEFEAERLARTLLPDIRVELTDTEFGLAITEAEYATAQLHLAAARNRPHVIGLAPGAKWSVKDWGEANWRSLLTGLSSLMPDSLLVFFGADDERSLAQRLATNWRAGSINLCGLLTPRQTAAAMTACRLLICHDSGPMHLAASVGVPTVAMFGNHNRPRRWFPYPGSHEVLFEPRGLSELSVSRVLSSVEAVLRKDAGTSRECIIPAGRPGDSCAAPATA